MGIIESMTFMNLIVSQILGKRFRVLETLLLQGILMQLLFMKDRCLCLQDMTDFTGMISINTIFLKIAGKLLLIHWEQMKAGQSPDTGRQQQ